MSPYRGVSRVLPYGFALALVATSVHLAWEYTHGGIQSHHLLARRDMPAISNGWGLLVLPVLGWLASRSAMHRAAIDGRAAGRALLGFAGALLVGVALSVAFITGYASAASALFLAALAAGLVLPTYRAEYIFGFVLGMSFILGAILPTLAALVAAMISVVAHFVLRPGAVLLFRKARG